MKVVYVKKILERIADEIKKAEAADREIEKVVLTVGEARKMLDQLGFIRLLPGMTCDPTRDFDAWLLMREMGAFGIGPQPEIRVMDLRVEVE